MSSPQHAGGFQVVHDGLYGAEAVEALVFMGVLTADLGIQREDADLRKIVTLTTA